MASENETKKFAFDESLVTHINGKKFWLMGIINTQSKDFCIVPVYYRNSNNLKNIIIKFVEKGNVIISYAWAGYNSFSSANSGYIHIVHKHGHGQFGFGKSTSHIENLWAIFKQKIKKIYNIIPSQNFPLYFREIEFRIIISHKTDDTKIKELFSIFEYISNTADFILYPIEDFIIMD